MYKVDEEYLDAMSDVYYCAACGAIEEIECVCHFDYPDFLEDYPDEN